MGELTRLREFLNELIPSEDQFQRLYQNFCAQIRKGLGAKTNKDADTKCYLTYVQDFPHGNETGKYLALDLGGSRFRVLLVTLKGDRDAELVAKIYDLTEKELLGTGTQLFDYIAKCLHEFVCEQKVEGEHMALGFTFSFPCVQTGLSRATLVRWTKGFNCSDTVGEDVGVMLKSAITRRSGLKIDMVAILNDTTGTQMSCAHRNPACNIGLIVGTGCNACYTEKVENCERLDSKYKDRPKIIINVEWGAFGEKGGLDHLLTDYDKIVDKNSLNAGTQIYEKMVAGMYMGELVRLILLRAVNENLIFAQCKLRKQITDILTKKPNCIETKVLSDIANDKGDDWPLVKDVFKDIFHLHDADPDDCMKFKYICDVVAKRAGNMLGVTLGALVNKVGESFSIIGVDGTVYRCHPNFDGYMRETLDRFVEKDRKYDIMLSEDGSGRGAALVAAVVHREYIERKSLNTRLHT
ncbi:PREDICTED: hexokinase-2-like [Bactrocera latifrons]|uniref:Phosphotransferase n=1 Tax=Bactrocera latifrons TaxID=174628 RepID=A0A0K8VI66_BACLA|nr:PREDICTED: hexokinase-2-like [Bactrocera latifrons]